MFIYNNTDILNPDDMKLRPMNGYGMQPYGRRTGLRVLSGIDQYTDTFISEIGYTEPYGDQTGLRPLSGLGGYIDDVIRDTGGLKPGQRITFEQAKYLYTGGSSKANPAQYAYMTPESFNSPYNPFGSLQAFLDYQQATLLRLTAQKAADDAYVDYTAARVEAAPAAAELLVFDANGRATDDSVAAAISYQNATAPGVAQAADKLEKAQANVQAVAQVITQQQSAAAAAAAAAAPKTYTDAELAGIIQTKLIDQAMTPGAIETELVTRYGVEKSRATALITAEFAALQTEYLAAQTAKNIAEAKKAQEAQQAAWNAEQARLAKAAADLAAQQAAEARAALAKAQADAAAALDALKKKTAADVNEYAALTVQQKVARYQAMRASGMTDAQIRAEVESKIGPQNDADWNLLRTLAMETKPAAGGVTTLPGPGTTPAAGGIGPLLLAVAAAYVLGA